MPIVLLTLARAYRTNGQIDLGRAAGREGLALLPRFSPHTAPTNTRRLFENRHAEHRRIARYKWANGDDLQISIDGGSFTSKSVAYLVRLVGILFPKPDALECSTPRDQKPY